MSVRSYSNNTKQILITLGTYRKELIFFFLATFLLSLSEYLLSKLITVLYDLFKMQSEAVAVGITLTLTLISCLISFFVTPLLYIAFLNRILSAEFSKKALGIKEACRYAPKKLRQIYLIYLGISLSPVLLILWAYITDLLPDWLFGAETAAFLAYVLFILFAAFYLIPRKIVSYVTDRASASIQKIYPRSMVVSYLISLGMSAVLSSLASLFSFPLIMILWPLNAFPQLILLLAYYRAELPISNKDYQI